MPDRLAYPLLALTAALLILVALVWPQGQGAPTPWLQSSASAAHASQAQPGGGPGKAQPSDPVAALAKQAVKKLKHKDF